MKESTLAEDLNTIEAEHPANAAPWKSGKISAVNEYASPRAAEMRCQYEYT